jgi:uncharacterized protein YjdB
MNSNIAKLLRSALPLAALLLAACGGAGGGGKTPAQPIPATLTAITITPLSATLAKGQIASFSATGKYSDASTQNLTSFVTWASSNPVVATIDPATGVASALTLGTSTISASMNGINSPTANLTVTAAVIAAINVTPLAVTTPKGAPTTFTATATYSDGTTGDVSATATWLSSVPTVATLNTSGIASSLGIGSSNVTASLAGITSGASVLTVAAPALTTIAINPPAATMAKGLTSNFTAMGTYTDASTADITAQVVWASANPVVAVIAPATGVATGAGLGTTTVNASAFGIVSPNASVTVTAAVLTGLNVTASATTLPKGAPVTLTAIGIYSDGSTGNVSGAAIWLSSNPLAVGVGVSGAGTTPATGVSNISASFAGFTSNAVTLTVTAPVLVSLAITPASVNVVINTTQQFTATGVLSDGTPATLGALTWASSGAGYASISATGLATASLLGSTNITASSGAVTSNTVVLAVVVAPGTKMGGAIQGTPLALTTAVTTVAGLAGAQPPIGWTGLNYALLDGVGSAARLAVPAKMTSDGVNIYFIDGNCAVRKMVIASNAVSTLFSACTHPTFVDLLGVTQPIYWADGLMGAAAIFGSISNLATDGVSLYVADGLNNMIRKVDLATGLVTTLAGGIVVPVPLGQTGVAGSLDGTGTAASFNNPSELTIDGRNLYVKDNIGIRKIDLATRIVSTVPLSFPLSATIFNLTTDGTNLYWTNWSEIIQFNLTTNVARVVAGNPASDWSIDGVGVNASFYYPTGMTSDGTNLYVTETFGAAPRIGPAGTVVQDGNRVRKVNIATGAVSTVAGSGAVGALDAPIGTNASFASMNGITTDGVSLYVLDAGAANTIRKIQ